jgi:ferredoxin
VGGVQEEVVMGKQFVDYEVYLVYVDPDKCDGCEKCIIYCPVDVFALLLIGAAMVLLGCYLIIRSIVKISQYDMVIKESKRQHRNFAEFME